MSVWEIVLCLLGRPARVGVAAVGVEAPEDHGLLGGLDGGRQVRQLVRVPPVALTAVPAVHRDEDGPAVEDVA